MNLKLNKTVFLKSTVFLVFLRSPVILLFIVAYLLTGKKALSTFLARMFPFMGLLLVFMLYSFYMGNDPAEIFGQARDIVLTLTVAFFLITASKDRGNNVICYNAIKVCFIILAIAKVLLILYTIVSGMNLITAIQAISKVWNLQMMTLSTDDSAVGRIQIPIDTVLPYFLYFYTKEIFETKKSKMGMIYYGLLCFSVLLTYSRLMWAQTILLIFISIVVEMKIKSQIKLFFSIVAVSLVVVYLTPFGDTLVAIVNSRFGSDASKVNDTSDMVRNMQNTALLTSIAQTPLFGHGLGYYIPTFIRSTETLYLYESQTLSMLMTLGYVGVGVWLIMIIAVLILAENKRSIPLGSMMFLCLWIVGASTNPTLFGASGGLILYFCSQFRKLNNMVVPKPEISESVTPGKVAGI